MNYQKSIKRLLSLVDHERIQPVLPRQKRIYDLGRMELLLERLGSPQLATPTIHIAGTKGKGSTAAMCDAALRAAGFRTGFYSSPHLHTFRERIRLNSQPLEEGKFAQLVADLWPHQAWLSDNSDLGPVSLFEFMTAMAFQCFKNEQAEFQTIEVGLGGRLDATNVLAPQVCVITSISLDHTAILGDTLEQIAGEKAGIVKPGVMVVVAPQTPEAMSAIMAVCRQKKANVVLVGEDITWTPTSREARAQWFTVKGRCAEYEINLPLLGSYQMENAATAIGALEVLQAQGNLIPVEAIIRGFGQVEWPCRMEVLSGSPLVVADGAHNAYSMDSLLQSLPQYFDYARMAVIVGFSRDKNVNEMVKLLSRDKPAVVVTRSRHPRSVPPEELAKLFKAQGLSEVVEATSVKEALDWAKELAGPGGLVLGAGSLFVAAEVREALLGIEPEIYPDLLPPDLRASGTGL